MSDSDIYNEIITIEHLNTFPNEKGLDFIAHLVDISIDLGRIEGCHHAIKLAKSLEQRNLTQSQRSLLHYFISNAWGNIRLLSGKNDVDAQWNWEQPESEKSIFHLRFALNCNGFNELEKERQCQILTNLGNIFSQVGRFVEALEYWNRAFSIVSSFPMAKGNRGDCLISYGQHLYDPGHKEIFFQFARADIKASLINDPNVPESARKVFERKLQWLNSVLASSTAEDEVCKQEFPLGSSEEEIGYRKWCLNNRLFLNPLNDLGTYSIAARDVFTTPSIAVALSEGPYYPGFFNQMKQELVSARFLYYEGIQTKQPHFSDKEVTIFNTFDYPSYSLAVEKVKAAFRITYPIFDKIAFFLNHYFALSIPEKRVTFRTLWYNKQDKNKGLLDRIQGFQNWPLRGLFWLSKDLYEDRADFKNSIEPDAKELSDVRNHLEHKYLKLHEDYWSAPEKDDPMLKGLIDTLAFSVRRSAFEKSTMRLMKIARASLIYLSLAIYSEEHKKAEQRPPGEKLVSMYLGQMEDHWKI